MEPERAPTRWDTVLKRIATRACEGLVIWNTYRAVRLSSDVEDLFKLIDDNFLLRSSTAAPTCRTTTTDSSCGSRSHTISGPRMRRPSGSNAGSRCCAARATRTCTADRSGSPAWTAPWRGTPRIERRCRWCWASVPRGERRRAPCWLGRHLVNISDEWNAAGLLTVTGKAWTPQPVRRWCCVHATPV